MTRRFVAGGLAATTALSLSVANDEMFKYKIGTTFDILLGTGIAAAILALLGGAAQQQGLIKLPF
ncbi:hypothetical protein CJ203_03760 [Corynebacterium tuscaniense]|uniref:Uncharacterized protein n=1 Tax=Corynebacterium tuscaniense TaxID=302449 RepID=A0A2N6T627_9CORY|nr:hypothetical protein [Corynebacterium tuscaniense]KGF23348.1 hypothetical protein HMPREF2129_04980 [Corynebacterium tuscaniense DNF00037]PMC64784.1 hypothetical protein CJ203_03760 [Corynebacterium tuscaniense]